MGLCNKKMASRGGGAGKDKAKRGRGQVEAPASPSRPSPSSARRESGATGPSTRAAPPVAAAPAAAVAVAAAPAVTAASAEPAAAVTAALAAAVSAAAVPVAPTPTASDASRLESKSAADQTVERAKEDTGAEAIKQLEESWSQKLQALEQSRRAEEQEWLQRQMSHERQLAEARRLLADAEEQLRKQRAEHDREIEELLAAAAAQKRAAAASTPATTATDIEPSRAPLLEDPDYPLFYEMIIYRKETLDQIEAPLEVGGSDDDEGAVNGERVVDAGDVSASHGDLDDGLSRVTPCTSQPYQWIVSLLVRFPKDGGDEAAAYRGTGCIVRLNDGGRVVVLTSASNLFCRRLGGQATEVTVVPARDGVGAPYGTYKVSADGVRVAPEYIASEDADSNFAALFLSVRSERSFGFGYATPSESQLAGRLVQSAGYPNDKPDGTMWLCGGPVSEVSGPRFRIGSGGSGRSARGSSGAPVWTWALHNFVLVGIRGPETRRAAGGGGKCLRLTPSLVDQVKSWSAEYK